MDISSIDRKFITKQEKLLNSNLDKIRPEVASRVEKIIGTNFSLHSFHAQIGSRNNTYIDNVRTKFRDSEDFIVHWLFGLMSTIEEQISSGSFHRRRYKPAEYYLIKYIKDPLVRDYIFTFLTRNFYRNYKERVRNKPHENLWSIWFGSGNLVYGLVIEPVLKNGLWTNDKSEMRRANYNYWTIGHIIETGLVDSSSDTMINFQDVAEFLAFYRNVIARTSQSPYEKQMCERYINYIKESESPLQELLLIPEFRYAGKEVKHLYRLDYTILNPYVMKMTGIEISPASTHVSITKAKQKSQKSINTELSQKWSREMDKRNSYFSKYGISTITFTNRELANMDRCFNRVKELLSERSVDATNLENAMSEVEVFMAKYEL